MKVQKGDNVQGDQVDEEYNFQDPQDNVALNIKNSNKVYYNITHRVKEDIKIQPVLLDGGNLKSYQI